MPGTPLYPFGYGLSYTTFKYGNLRVDPAKINQGGRATVTVEVENTGKRAGTEVAQMYLHERYAPVSLPVEQLRGFERVTLNPGETKTVTFTIRPEDLMLLDRDSLWRVAPGSFDVLVGPSSADIAVQGAFEVMDGLRPSLERGFSLQPDLAR
jgi:beta-glucosidase